MHFTKTMAAAFAVVVSVSALPVLKRDDAVIGDPANPVDDLLTNVQGGLVGALDFLSIPSGSDDKKKRDVVGDAANPLDDLLTNVDSGAEGLSDFLGVGQKKKKE